MVNSDLVIYATPLTAGFITSEIKKTMDRSIGVALPYINVYDGESHHPPRYENVANRAIMIFEDDKTDQEAVENVFEYFDRVTLNMHNEKMYKCLVTADSVEEKINEIINS